MPSSDANDFEEPIRILSDLHLGHPGSKVTDIAQIRPLLEGAKTVIFNGDTYELRKQSLLAITDKFRADLEALIDELGIRAVFLTGNHDPEFSDTHYLDLAGGKIFITHGDLLYDDVSPWSKLIDSLHEQRTIVRETYPENYLDDLDLRLKASKQIAARTNIRKAKGKPGLSGRINALLAELWPPKRPLRILKTWATAHHLAHDLRDQFRPDADIIIIGHTHRAVVHERSGKRVINTGAYLPVSGTYVVEIDANRLRIIRAKQQRNRDYALLNEVASLDW